jgi:hypothetical protein
MCKTPFECLSAVLFGGSLLELGPLRGYNHILLRWRAAVKRNSRDLKCDWTQVQVSRYPAGLLLSGVPRLGHIQAQGGRAGRFERERFACQVHDRTSRYCVWRPRKP